MATKTDIHLQKFVSIVYNTLFVNNDIDIVPQFYMTHYCNLACPGCYMAAGPHQSKAYIPSADIDFYLREFNKNSYFPGNVTFSGGEIFSLPIEYLKYNIQNALDLGMFTEIKTNGSWVDNPVCSDLIFEMLADLSVPRRLNVIDTEQGEFLRGKLLSMGKEKIWKKVCDKFGTFAALSMAVSVDDKIHPRRSAQWFAAIANRITADDALSQNVELKSFSFKESANFLRQNVLNNPQLGVSDLHSDAGVYSYKVGKGTIRSYVGDFINTAAPLSPAQAADIVIPRGNGHRFVVFFFWPDRTVSFENSAFHPVGRVPYLDSHGKYKSLNTLVQEMGIKMISDYQNSIGR